MYLLLKKEYIRTALTYRLNFALMMLSGVLGRAMVLGVVATMFEYISSLAGLSIGLSMYILSMIFITEGLCNIFFDGVWAIPALAFSGEFDVLLSRPMSILLQVISYDIGLHGFGTLLAGIATLIYSFVLTGLFSVVTLFLTFFFIVCGTIIRLSMNLIGSSLFFFTSGGYFNANYCIHTVGEYARYPLPIYPRFIQLILSVLIPYAFIGYYPAMILSSYNMLLILLMPIVPCLTFMVGRKVFYEGVRKYESVGS